MKSLEKFFIPQPINHKDVFYVIYCYCDFEPFGRASETWERVYEIEFTDIPYHYYSTTGWKEGTSGNPMSFKAESMDKLEAKALSFLKWYFRSEPKE